MMKPSRRIQCSVLHDLGLDEPEVEVEFLGMKNGEGLWSYTLPDGRYYEEFVQHKSAMLPDPFLALKDSAGQVVLESLWSGDAISFVEWLQVST